MFLKYLSANPTEEQLEKPNCTMIEYIKNVFGESSIKESIDLITHSDFYKACYDPYKERDTEHENKRKKIKTEFEKKIYDAIKELNTNLENETNITSAFSDPNSPDYIKFKDLVSSIPFGSSHELASTYLDRQHFKFANFHPKHIINTNLRLTWQFYKFALDKKDNDWDTLNIISNTGKAFFNLDKYQNNSGSSHLENILNTKKG